MKERESWYDEECSKFLDQRMQANLHRIQDPRHVNGDNCNNVTREIIWGCRNVRGNV